MAALWRLSRGGAIHHTTRRPLAETSRGEEIRGRGHDASIANNMCLSGVARCCVFCTCVPQFSSSAGHLLEPVPTRGAHFYRGRTASAPSRFRTCVRTAIASRRRTGWIVKNHGAGCKWWWCGACGGRYDPHAPNTVCFIQAGRNAHEAKVFLADPCSN